MSNRRDRRRPLETDPAPIEPPGPRKRLSRWLGLGGPPGPVCVADVRSAVEADLMAGFLRSHGINAHVSGDDAGGTNPVYQLAFGVRVLVPADQADEARRLLADANS